jgi:hypothetical protein
MWRYARAMKGNFQSKDTEDFNRPSEAQASYIQCQGFRCLAYRDQNGVWRNYFSGEAVEVIGVLQDGTK